MFTKTQRIVASIALGAAVGAFIGEVVSALSLLAGFAFGGVVGGLVGFITLNYRGIRQQAPKIWEELRQDVSYSRVAFTKQLFKTVLSLLFLIGQWIIAAVLVALFATPESSSATSGQGGAFSLLVYSGGLLALSMFGYIEAKQMFENNIPERELISRKLLENLNIFMLVYYLIRGIRWILIKSPKWMFFTVIPAVFLFLARLVKVVYSDESLLVITWATFGAIAGIWLATTPITAAFAGAIAGAIFGGSQVYFICIPLGLISPATNNH